MSCLQYCPKPAIGPVELVWGWAQAGDAGDDPILLTFRAGGIVVCNTGVPRRVRVSADHCMLGRMETRCFLLLVGSFRAQICVHLSSAGGFNRSNMPEDFQGFCFVLLPLISSSGTASFFQILTYWEPDVPQDGDLAQPPLRFKLKMQIQHPKNFCFFCS